MKYPFGVLRLFFSLRCNFKCGYCSMMSQKDLWRGDEFIKDEVTPDKWNDALHRLEPQRNLIVTPCNAEPPIYNGCADIVNDGLKRFQTHMYTNLSSLSMEEIRKMKNRNDLAFYVSYHRGQIPVEEFIENAKELQSGWNVINFHAPMYPPFKEQILADAELMKKSGILLDTTHEYLGMYNGEMCYSYLKDGQPEAGDWIKKRLANRLEGTPKRKVLCKTSYNHDSFFSRAYTVAPDGDIYNCWRHLYNHDKKGVVGNFFDPEFEFNDEPIECDDYGDCNICAWHKDIKDADTGEQLDMDTKVASGKTISACMIVKDEEAVIEDCLASIHEWVDEIILVDTGSTDKTVEIAKTFSKVKLFNQPWQDDFSYHRNYSIEQATKDWIFIIDADERVIPGHGENLKKMLPSIEQDLLYVDIYNLYGQPRVAKSFCKSIRFSRRSYGLKYTGRVHNMPVVIEGSQLYTIPFRINHFGYDMPKDVMEKKDIRRQAMCKKWVEDDPENPIAYYHYAQAMKAPAGEINIEGIPKVIKILEAGLSKASGSIRLQLLYHLAEMNHAAQNHDKAISYANKAIASKPDYLDAIFIMGLAYTALAGTPGTTDEKRLESINKGEEWLQKYLREQKAYNLSDSFDSIVMEHINDRKFVYQILMSIEGWKERQSIC